MLRLLAMPWGLACAEVCRPPGFISRRLRPGRRCPLCNNQSPGPQPRERTRKFNHECSTGVETAGFWNLGCVPSARELCITAAPFNRDDFLPVPTGRLEHWERYVCKYFEATVLARSVDGTKLLCPHVPGDSTALERSSQLARVASNSRRSGRMPSGIRYVRTARRRISVMQSHVAKLLRQGKREQFGEADFEEDISERLQQFWVSLKKSSVNKRSTGRERASSERKRTKTETQALPKRSKRTREET